jgi:hypothetical protein
MIPSIYPRKISPDVWPHIFYIYPVNSAVSASANSLSSKSRSPWKANLILSPIENLSLNSNCSFNDWLAVNR